MAGEAVIGALRVVIGADSASLEKDLGKAEGRFSSFTAAMKKVDAGVVALGAAALSAGAAIAVGVQRAIDRADELVKSSQKWGVPIEQLSALRFAADLSGVSFEGLGTSLSKLSRNMAAIAGGDTNTASQALAALGVSVRTSSGDMRSANDVMLDVAEKFRGMEDGAGKTALAMAVFGKSGANLIPLLNAGRKGIQEMTDEASQLGLVINNDTGKAAEHFNDNMTRLARVWDGFINQLLPALLPSLNAVTNSLVDGAKATGSFKWVAEQLGQVFSFVTAEVVRSIAQATAFKDLLVGLGTAAEQFVNLNFSAGLNTLTTSFSGMSAALALADQNYEKMTAAGNNLAVSTGVATENVKKVAAPIIQSADAANKAAEAWNKWVEGQVKKQATDVAELQTMGLLTGAKERLTVVLQGQAVAQANNLVLSEKQRQKLEEVAASAGNLALQIKGANLVLEAREPHEKYRAELANNIAAMQAAGATDEQIMAMRIQLAEKYNNTWGQVSESVAGSFQKIGAAFEGESRGMAKMAKIAGIAQATISMLVGGAKALELPFPANIAAAAAVIAQGAAIVAQIRGVGGFAEGGSFRVPGPGGRDNQRYMVDLSPGEQVDIWRPGDGGGDPRQGGGETTIHIHGENFSQKTVRRLIHEINQASRDGSIIRVAGG